MNIDNITQGECLVIEHSWSDTSIVVGGKTVFTISIYDEATEDTQEELELEASANCELIQEAFNVANETGLSPRELQQQNNELREALEKMCKFHEINASWDKGDNGYYEAKSIIQKHQLKK